MHLWRALLVAAVAVVISSGSVWAQEQKPPKPKLTQDEVFKKLDKDGDGAVSKDEFMAPSVKKPELKEKLDARFAKLDKNGDGKLTLEEFKAKSAKGAKKEKKTQ